MAQVVENVFLSSGGGVTVIAVPFLMMELQFMCEPFTACWKHFILGSALCKCVDIRS